MRNNFWFCHFKFSIKLGEIFKSVIFSIVCLFVSILFKAFHIHTCAHTHEAAIMDLLHTMALWLFHKDLSLPSCGLQDKTWLYINLTYEALENMIYFRSNTTQANTVFRGIKSHKMQLIKNDQMKLIKFATRVLINC